MVLSNEEIQLHEFLLVDSWAWLLNAHIWESWDHHRLRGLSLWLQLLHSGCGKEGGKAKFRQPLFSPPSYFQQLKNKFIKKIPKDAEASNVLVGEVEFLEKPFVAFVRLLQATMLGGVTEVPVPTR